MTVDWVDAAPVALRRSGQVETVGVTEDDAFCVAMLPQVSRTFALSIEALSPPLRDAVRVAYLLCRIADSIEDATEVEPQARQRLFDAFESVVGRDDEAPEGLAALCAEALSGLTEAEARLASGAAAVVRAFRRLPPAQRTAIRPAVLTMSAGMRAYSARLDRHGALGFVDEADLEQYCYHVAGTVGELLTGLFLDAVPVADLFVRERIWTCAAAFGAGLQLVNMVKDVAEDYERGVCFVPEQLAANRGIELDELLQPDCRPQALDVLGDLCDWASRLLRRAEEYVLLWPAGAGDEVRLFCAVPLALALATLSEVARGQDTLRPGTSPKIGRAEVASVLARAQDAVGDDQALARLFGAYRQRLDGARAEPRCAEETGATDVNLHN